MKYHELTLSSHKNAKRVGRGIAAGQGKTAGRGTKGQKSRTGSTRKPGFEGGQNPLSQRLPKLRGFRSFHEVTENIYTGQLDTLPISIDNFVLADLGMISSAYTKVKIISKGAVSKKHTVKLQAASASAVSAIQKAGGSFVITKRIARAAKVKE